MRSLLGKKKPHVETKEHEEAVTVVSGEHILEHESPWKELRDNDMSFKALAIDLSKAKGDAIAFQLADILPKNRSLKDLRLLGIGKLLLGSEVIGYVSTAGVRALAHSLRLNTTLTRLDLPTNSFGPEAIKLLCQVFGLCRQFVFFFCFPTPLRITAVKKNKI